VYTNLPILDHLWGVLFRDIDITAGLERLTSPVLVLLGRHDYLMGPPQLWERVRPAFRHLTLRVLEQSGHTPQLEAPAQFDHDLLEWLAATQRAAAPAQT
jgi:proline iminopeptidase